ncbi:MAG: hypothetical protein JXB30_02515 [Anaerolineae bacterium]|nr:hypothetical protein [Anaerolineae bacterium]
MNETMLYVEKDTDLMRSTFIAVGLASLFYHLDEAGSGIDVRIRDGGSAYALEVTRYRKPVSREELLEIVRQRGLPPLLPAILKPPSAGELKRIEQGESPEAVQRKYLPDGFGGDKVNYGEEKQKAEARPKKRKGEPRQEGDTPQRHPDFPLWAHLCSYFGKGSAMRIGYPLVLHAWHSHAQIRAESLLTLLFDTYGTFPPDIPAARETWLRDIKPTDYPDFEIFGWQENQADISALSIVSPSTAQGSCTVTGSRPPNSDTPDAFWLEMYLAFAGYMVIGMPYRSSGDVLLYYPIPRDISFGRLVQLLVEYRQKNYVNDLYDYSNLMPRAKLDALSQIDFYRAMVEHYLTNPPERRRIDAVSGIAGYYYKDISTQIPFDETVFALPLWLPDEVDADLLEAVKAMLEAHRAPIAALRGEYAEELVILNSYRRFVTLGDPDNWIVFAVQYGIYRFQKLEESPWLPWLHLNTLEGTLMNQTRKDYRPILETEGVRNIAAAIRYCTVQLRYWKDVKKQTTAFKVRHGLGDDLRRHAHNADNFIEDLSGFVSDYQRESSSVQANTGETRPFITSDDLYQVIELVNTYGSRVVASLLVAAGYASDYERQTEQVS